MAISGGDGSIILDTKVDESGLKKGTNSLRSEAMKLAAVYRKAGMSQSEAQKRAYKELGITAKETDKVTKKTKEFGNESEKSGSKASRAYGGVKSAISAMGRAFAVVGVAGLTAFAGITKAAVDSYAEYEQLSGGVQKIFDEIDYSKIAEDAGNAYKTMGMSANEYLGVMTTVGANFASTLGDAKGYEVAKQGMQAISDFASGTGRSVDELSEKYQMITKSTSSYQSIADQFAGILPATSADFLEQAQAAGFLSDSYTKLTEVPMAEYQEAVTQMLSKGVDALGLTGNTAMEASTTLSGSTAMMKASWQNLLTGMADPTQDFDALLQNFITSIGAFAGNLLPVVQTAAQGVLQMVQGLLPQLASMITQMLPMVVDGVVGIVNGIVQVAPQIVEAIVGLLPQLLTATTNLITQIATALPALMQVIVSALPTMIQSIVAALPTMIPALINGIIQAMVILIAALPQIIQPIIDNLPMIITSITGALIGNLPILIQGAIQLVVALVAALPQIIMALLEAMGGVAIQIGNALFKALPGPVQNAFKAAFDAIKAVWDLVQPYFAIIWEQIKAIFSVAGAVIGGYFKTAWAMIKAVWDTVTGYFSAIWDTIAGIFSVVASVLSGNWSDAWDAIKGIVSTWASFFSGVWESIKSVFSAVGSWFTNIFSTAWQGIQNVWGAVVNFFSGIWNGIVGVFSGVSSWFSSIFSSAVSGIKNVWSSITGWFSSKWAEIKNVFSDAKSKFLSIGSDIVAGIKQGISNAWGNLKSWFQGLFGDLKSIAKKILGIASPSKYFIWIAQMIVAGLTKGIDKYGKLAIRGVKELGMDVVDVFDEIIPEIADNLLKDHRTEVQKVLDDANEEMLDSERFYAEESLRIEREKEEKEYQEKVKAAKNKKERQKIENERQEKLQEEANKAYLDGLKETAEKERKIFDARKKDVENLKETIVNAYSDMASKALDSISELQKTQESLAEKLAGYGGLTYEKTYKNRYGKKVTESWLSDLSEQTEFLEEYYDMLMKVKDRGNVPKEFFSVIRDMGLEEGLEYANSLLELSDEDFANYIREWERKQETAKHISKALYEDEATELATSINDEFDSLKDDMFGIGKNSASEFGDGFIRQLNFLAHDIRYALQSALSGVTIGGIGPVISGGIDVIKVPALARGGIAPRKMLAMIGERGREAVLPLENNTGWMDALADRISARMSGASSTVVLEVDGREFGRAVVEQGNRENRRIGTRLVNR